MDTQQPPEGISTEQWTATPETVRGLVSSLLQTVKQLKQKVADLEERLNQHSGNSSKPPSSDPPHQRRKTKHKESGRKRGGQPGHVGAGRKLKPPDQVSRVVISKPTTCTQCGGLLLGQDPHPQRHQVCELPRIEPEVVEYQVHRLTCLGCGCENHAAWPEEMPAGSFGPRTQALVGYLTGRFGVSHRDVQELFETVFHVDIGLGSIAAQAKQVQRAVEHPMIEAQHYVRQQPTVNVDETGWHEMGTNCWLWVVASPAVTVFRLTAQRNADVLKQLLSEAFAGIVGSDRYSAYTWLGPMRRQLCWSHLKRDVQAFIDRGGESAIIGRLLVAQVTELFAMWYRVRDGTLSREQFQAAMHPIRTQVEALLELGTLVDHRKTRATCQRILTVRQALWSFVDHEGVEPTNNTAERALRRGVIWRRRSFGTQSRVGSQFVAAILTVVTTLRQQQRNVLDYLTDACRAAIVGVPAPSLLPGA